MRQRILRRETNKGRGTFKRFKNPGLAPRQRKQVKSLITRGEEIKFYVSSNAVATTATAQIFDIFAPAQGLTDSQRVGDEVKLKKIRAHLQFIKDTASTAVFDFVRVIFFQWRPSSSFLAPTPGQLLLTDPSLGAISHRSFYSVDTQHEYSILKDKTYVFSGSAGTAWTNGLIKQHNFRVPLKRAAKNVQFQATTVEGSHKIYCLIIGANALTGVAFNLQTQAWYGDS